MRFALLLCALALVGACTDSPSSPQEAAGQEGLRDRQEAACVAAIAAHIRQPASVLTSRWLSSENGIAEVETVDGTRLHRCQVDADARVLGYTHPGH